VLALQRTAGNRATARLLAGRRTLQRYTIHDDWQVSANNRILLDPENGELLATEDVIAEANQGLAQVGRGSDDGAPGGSFIELVATGEALPWGSHELFAVQPTWRFTQYYPAEDFSEGSGHYHKQFYDAVGDDRDTYQAKGASRVSELTSEGRDDDATALQEIIDKMPTDRMPMWADCSKASALVTGSNDAYTGREAVYYQGTQARRARGGGLNLTGVQYKGHANKLAHELYLRQIAYFVAQPANAAHLVLNMHYTGTAAAPVPIVPTDVVHAKQMYAGLVNGGQAAFDREARINEYANPQIGEAYAIATEPEMPGFSAGDFTWNQHWAGVAMKDGGDNVTLEGFAQGGGRAQLLDVPQDEIISRDWQWAMYGTLDPTTGDGDAAQTFHSRHKGSGHHGSHATSMSVRSTR
jgi:hypothetical protein